MVVRGPFLPSIVDTNLSPSDPVPFGRSSLLPAGERVGDRRMEPSQSFAHQLHHGKPQVDYYSCCFHRTKGYRHMEALLRLISLAPTTTAPSKAKPELKPTSTPSPPTPSPTPVATPAPVKQLPAMNLATLEDVSNYLGMMVDRLYALAQALPPTASHHREIDVILEHVQQHRQRIREVFAAAQREPTKKNGDEKDSVFKAIQQEQEKAVAALQQQASLFAKDMDAKVEQITQSLTKELLQKADSEKSALLRKMEGEHVKKLADQAQAITTQYQMQLEEKSEQLARKHKNEVQYMVDRERAGRLAKLDHLVLKLKVLEQMTLAYGEQLQTSHRAHKMWASFHALLCTLDTDRRVDFSRELTLLKDSSNGDEFVRKILKTLPNGVEKRGLTPLSELKSKFYGLEHQIREVSLVPEDGGLEAHMLSYVASKLLFRKSGSVGGEDVEAILARAEHALLVENDLDAATREINQLHGWAKAVCRDWLKSAREHLEVKQTMSVLQAHLALQSLRQ